MCVDLSCTDMCFGEPSLHGYHYHIQLKTKLI